MPGKYKFTNRTTGRSYEMPWEDPTKKPTEGQLKHYEYEQEHDMSTLDRATRGVKETASSVSEAAKPVVSKALSGPMGLGTAISNLPAAAKKVYDWSNEQISETTDPRTYTRPAAERLRKADPEADAAIEIASRMPRAGGDESPLAGTSRKGMANLVEGAGEIGSMATTPAGAIDIAGLAASPFTGGTSALPAIARWTARGASAAGRLGGVGQAIHGAEKAYNEPTLGGKALGVGEALLGAYGAGHGGSEFADSIKNWGRKPPPSMGPKGLPAYEPPTGPIYSGRQGASRNLGDLTDVDLTPSTPAQDAFNALIPERYKPTVLQPETPSRTIGGEPAGPLVPKKAGERLAPAAESIEAYPPGDTGTLQYPSKRMRQFTKARGTENLAPDTARASKVGKGSTLSAQEVGNLYGEPVGRALKNKKVKSLGPNERGVELFEAIEEPIFGGQTSRITPEGLRPQVGDVSEIPAGTKSVGVGSTETVTSKGGAKAGAVSEAGESPIVEKLKATLKDVEAQGAPVKMKAGAPKLRDATDKENEMIKLINKYKARGDTGKADIATEKLRSAVKEKGGTIDFLEKKGSTLAPEKSTAKDVSTFTERAKGETGALQIGKIAESVKDTVKWAKENPRKLWNLPRGLQSAGDLSALRQAFPLIRKAKYWKNIKPMLRAAAKEGNRDDYMLDLYTHKNYDKAEKAGLAISEKIREEDRLSTALDKIPGYKQSNNAFEVYLKKLRIEEFSDLVDKAERKLGKISKKTGKPLESLTDKEYEQIAKYVNDATGRGRLPLVEGTKVAGLASDVLFSPRLFTSRLSFLNPRNYTSAHKRMPRGLRFERAKSVGGMLGATAAAQGIGAATGAKLTSDPTSSDFGKLRYGNLRIDPMGGFQQPLVLGARALSGGYTNPTTGEHKKYGRGYGAKSLADQGVDFVSSKLNPLPAYGWDMLNATEYRPFNMADRAVRLGTPLTAQDTSELLQEYGPLDPKVSSVAPAFFGLGGLQQFNKYGEGQMLPKSVRPNIFNRELTRPQFWDKDAWRKIY